MASLIESLTDEQKNMLFYMNTPMVRGAYRQYSHTLNIESSFYDIINLIIPFKLNDENDFILESLKFNYDNSDINHIYLVCDREYSIDELRLDPKYYDKVHQIINNDNAVTYEYLFNVIDEESINGYMIISEPDVFFDSSITKLFTSGLDKDKIMVALLARRYNYENELSEAKIIGPCWDKQHAFIFHKNYNIINEKRSHFSVPIDEFLSCSKVVFYLNLLGYKINNSPNLFRAFKFSQNIDMQYKKPKIMPPYGYVIPEGVSFEDYNTHFEYKSMIHYTKNFSRWNYKDDNKALIDNLTRIISNNNKIFIIDSRKSSPVNQMRYFNKCNGYFCGEIYGSDMSEFDEFNNKKGVHEGKIEHWSAMQSPSNVLYIEPFPWTHRLALYRILVFCKDVDSLKDKDNLKSLWPNDTINYVEPSVLEENESQLKIWYDQLEDIKDEYDLAIVYVDIKYNNDLAFYLHDELDKHVIVSNFL